MKKLVTSLTVVAAAAALAACGGNSTNNATAVDEAALNEGAINENFGNTDAGEDVFANDTTLSNGAGLAGNDTATDAGTGNVAGNAL